ncbi:MAG: hypothetical protein ACFFD1_02445 [Candidatus Thorarchaeota archaeon]
MNIIEFFSERNQFSWTNSIAFIIFFILILILSSPANESILFWIFLFFGGFLIILSDSFVLIKQLNDPEIKKIIEPLKYSIRFIGYIFLLFFFIFTPPGSPVTFIIPMVASLDYYLILSAYWSAGILYATWKIIDLLFFTESSLNKTTQ